MKRILVIFALTTLALLVVAFTSYEVGIYVGGISAQTSLKSIHLSYCEALGEIKEEKSPERKNEMIQALTSELYQSSWNSTEYIKALDSGVKKIREIEESSESQEIKLERTSRTEQCR